jgi:hypothetical protein
MIDRAAGKRTRRAVIAAALGLLPGAALAQVPQQRPSGPPPRPGPPSRPGPPPRPRPPTIQPVRPGAYRPLPPRGNQFWHRGQYYGRVPGPAFAYPPGWRYRQWGIGARLPPVLFAPGYVFQGWAPLGLQAPVPGYAWVRFGPDLLLVNQSTGEVEDVVYGVFL